MKVTFTDNLCFVFSRIAYVWPRSELGQATGSELKLSHELPSNKGKAQLGHERGLRHFRFLSTSGFLLLPNETDFKQQIPLMLKTKKIIIFRQSN